jgi:hypothetical protein
LASSFGLAPVKSFEEEKPANAAQAELARQSGQGIDVFFHRIADEDEGTDRHSPGFVTDMPEDAGDLRLPALAGDPAHQPRQTLRLAQPSRGPAFGDAAEIDQLHGQFAARGRDLKHPGLQ